MKRIRQGISTSLASCLMFVTVCNGFAFQSSPPPQPQAVEESPQQLQQLVAPIALYPDALVAQILSAATYPEEVLDAANWLDQHKNLQGAELAAEVDKQSWDPSVKAMTQFPSVLSNMKQNLAWTSELGDTWVNQKEQLNDAIQTMRAQAKTAGNLTTTPQEKVSTKGKTIVIEPTSPDVVYVPEYDPWLAYGYPLAVFPGWYPYPGLFLDGPGIAFGLGFGIGFFGGFGWGWGHWGFDWHHGGRAVFNHNTFISHSRTIVNRGGFGQGAEHSFSGRDAFHGGSFRESGGMRSGAFSGFNRGGFAGGSGFRGGASFGGGFHGGGRR